jgi:hypothetical protein
MDRDGAAKSSEDAGRGENSILHAEDDFADARQALYEELLRSWIEGRHARSARAGNQYFLSAGPNKPPGSQSAGHNRPERNAHTTRRVSLTLRPTFTGLATQ